MNLTDLKPLAALPVCIEVRRTSIAAGVISALFTGGLPFVGFDSGLIMGRASLLPTPLAFVLHLVVALTYGALFCLAISRSRNGWTMLAATSATLGLYACNFALARACEIPRLLPETDALVAHLLFGAAFTLFFKLAEIGVPEQPAPHAFPSSTAG